MIDFVGKTRRRLLLLLAACVLSILSQRSDRAAAASPVEATDALPNQVATAQTLSLAEIFPTDRVLDVQITLDQRDWDKIRQQSRNLFEVLQEKRKTGPIDHPYTYVNASVTIDGVEFSQVGIRKKGFIGSQSTTRPSLKIKLNHLDKRGGVEGLTNLTFNNNHQDPTLVSQFMGYALFRAAGSPAPRCAFAKVTVNGQSLGVYSHVESIRKPLLQREFGNDEGTLYEGTVVDFHEGWEGSFERKFGKDKPGRKKIAQLVTVMMQADREKDDEQAIGELVDLDSFYTYWALEGLLGFWDGYSGNSNNFFVYLNPETDKFHFLPWGADAVYEKFSKLGHDPKAPLSVKTKGIIAHKLYQQQSSRERYAKTLLELLEEHWDEPALLAETDRIEAMLKPHLHALQSQHGSSLDRVRKFIRSRREELVAEISAGMPVWTRVPDPPPIIPAAFTQDPNSIWNAAKTGDIDKIKKQLSSGTDVNAKDRSGTTPLSMAAVAGQTEVVRFLIGELAEIDAQNNDGHSALHGAAFLGRLDVARLLIENEANVSIRNNDGETPLDSAAAEWSDEIQGFVQFLSTILQMEVDMEGVKAGRPKVAALLLEHGATSGTDLPKPAGRNVWESAKLGNTDALRMHLAKDGDVVNSLDNSGISPLSWASMAGQVEAVKLLIAEGAAVDAKNRDGSSSLHGAAFLGHLEVVEVLIDSNADVNVKNNMGETPLGVVAAEWNQGIQDVTRFIAGFLKLKVDVDEIKAARPNIAALLRQHGGKTAAEIE